MLTCTHNSYCSSHACGPSAVPSCRILDHQVLRPCRSLSWTRRATAIGSPIESCGFARQPSAAPSRPSYHFGQVETQNFYSRVRSSSGNRYTLQSSVGLNGCGQIFHFGFLLNPRLALVGGYLSSTSSMYGYLRTTQMGSFNTREYSFAAHTNCEAFMSLLSLRSIAHPLFEN